MERLPYIDEHVQRIDASPEAAWSALVGVLRRSFGGSGAVARLLGCEPAGGSARFEGDEGETLPGFRVVEADPGRRLVLRGRHRFSRYELALVLEAGELRARTSAVFPGPHGRLYRAAVIGTGGHRIVTRRLLAQVASQAASVRPEVIHPTGLR
jgi:hypothetical protein